MDSGTVEQAHKVVSAVESEKAVKLQTQVFLPSHRCKANESEEMWPWWAFSTDKHWLCFMFARQTQIQEPRASIFINVKESRDYSHSLSHRYPSGMSILVLLMDPSVLNYLATSFWDQLVFAQSHMWLLRTSLAAPSTYHPPTPRSGARPLFVQCLLPLSYALLLPSLTNWKKRQCIILTATPTFRASGRCWFMKRLFHITNGKTGFGSTDFLALPPNTHTTFYRCSNYVKPASHHLNLAAHCTWA